MHLPLELWCATKELLTDTVRAPITKFSERILEVKEKNVGLFLYGEVGSGKTGAACVVLKEARAWGFTAYAISVTELRDAVRTYAAFDSESTIMDRARNVDFLLLDDLREEDASEKIFGINDIRNLIVSRHDRGLPTVITSLLGPMAWSKISPSIASAAEKCCAVQKVVGDNRHEATAKAKNEFLE
jgi:DNA replication protein DnaC